MSELAAALAAQFSSNAAINALLLTADALIYFAVLAGLFRARHRIGIGAFFCALGVMHFLETYLASILYVALPFGIVASPGSTVLFTGKLMLLLLVYIREDAVVVCQPIYGLLIGNLLLFALPFLTRQHGAEALAANRHADFGFLDEMGAPMVWGTLILFADCIMMILIYERSRAFIGGRVLPRLVLTGALGGTAAPPHQAPVARHRRVRPPHLSRALRGSPGALRARRADRRARPQPARASGAQARRRGGARRPGAQPSHHRHR